MHDKKAQATLRKVFNEIKESIGLSFGELRSKSFLIGEQVVEH